MNKTKINKLTKLITIQNTFELNLIWILELKSTLNLFVNYF